MTGPWCYVDACPASVCGGPHRAVQTDLGTEILTDGQQPIGTPTVTPTDVDHAADAGPAPDEGAPPMTEPDTPDQPSDDQPVPPDGQPVPDVEPPPDTPTPPDATPDDTPVVPQEVTPDEPSDDVGTSSPYSNLFAVRFDRVTGDLPPGTSAGVAAALSHTLQTYGHLPGMPPPTRTLTGGTTPLSAAFTVTRVIDGDTLVGNLTWPRQDVGYGRWIALGEDDCHVRLMGCDASELNTTAGRGAAEAVAALYPPGTTVTTRLYSRLDKYGRHLAYLPLPDGSRLLSDWLIEHGYAVMMTNLRALLPELA